MAETSATTDTAKPARKARTPNAPAVDADTGITAESGADTTASPKARFAQAIDEARAGATALTAQVQDNAGAYREKLVSQGETLLEEAKEAAAQAREKAAVLAHEGKTRAVEGIATVSKAVADNAGLIDEKLGPKYGDYARTAAKSLDVAAARLEAKDLAELGEDAREFVRKSPALAVGIAAAAGFMISRLFKGSGKADD